MELWARKFPVILPKFRLPRKFTCRKSTTWDRRLYFPSEGRRAEDFFTLKIQQLRSGLNPWTWVLKASTLPLDHQSRYLVLLCIIIPSKFIQNIAELWYISYMTWRDKKVLVEYQTRSAEYSIARDTGRAKCANPNILQWNDTFWLFYGHFTYTDSFSSPDEMLWCG